jgi:predicted dehydrogenase
MERLSRRRFLEDSLAALTASAAATAMAPAALAAPARKRVSPNDKIHMAVIGFNGQGMSHISNLLGKPDVELVALCDVDTAVIDKGVAAVTKAGKPAPKTYQDIRKLLEDGSIDAVSIATPNHWHALAAIWSMQAGKDVYVEKPISHEVAEGRRIVEVARKLGRICQCGTQSRSQQGMREAIEYLHAGKLGKIRVARALCYKPRASIGLCGGPQAPPATVDYDLWLGPAPMKDVRRKRFHYDWHWFWDYGNGDIGNQGIHEMDKARWGLGARAFPKRVMSLGGRFGYVDDGETPNTLLSFMDYGDAQLIFEVRGLNTPDLMGAKVGNIWYGTEGVMVAPSYNSAVVYDNDGNKVAEFQGGGDHHANFLKAVRSRKRSDLNADCEEGHLSSALCHLANISYRLGALEPYDKTRKLFGSNREASETFERYEEHLAANHVTPQETEYRVGKTLQVRGEGFGADEAANAYLTRPYRKGFEVPAKA